MSTEEFDLTRLPKKWQRYIASREVEIRNLKQHIEELSAGPDESDTYIKQHGMQPDQPLGHSPSVTFNLGSDMDSLNTEIHVRVAERTGYQKHLLVMANALVSIHPQASNTFRVELRN